MKREEICANSKEYIENLYNGENLENNDKLITEGETDRQDPPIRRQEFEYILQN